MRLPGRDGHADSQADGLRALLALAVERAGNLVEEAAMHDGRALKVLENLAPAPDVPRSIERAPQVESDEKQKSGRAASRGRHAATPPPYLERRGARFVVFSAIGGAVFLMGLGLQAVLTGAWHMQPIVSYAIQAVVSVESSFLLNRWLTWRDRATPFWIAFARFNAQKTVTIALNLALYEGLLRLGVNYLVANVALTAVFTVVNYVAGDRLCLCVLRREPSSPLLRQCRISADIFQAPGQRSHPVPEQRGNDRCRSQVSARPELPPSPRDHPDWLPGRRHLGWADGAR